LGELARLRPSRAELHEAGYQGLQDERTPMSLELENMLTCVRMRGREEEGEPGVYRLVVGVQKSCEGRATG
jgi:hypothetical protein